MTKPTAKPMDDDEAHLVLTLTIRPAAGWPMDGPDRPTRRLRALLKRMLRTFGWRVVSATLPDD